MKKSHRVSTPSRKFQKNTFEGLAIAPLLLCNSSPIPVAQNLTFHSDGRQVNNLLAYPGIFKGALETRSSKINDDMLFAAVQAIVEATPKGDIVPSALDPKIHEAVTRAVAKAAMKSGVAQRLLDDELLDA